MNILFFTNEYPPEIYGGAGVHVENLSAELARLAQVEVRCFGEQHQPENPLSIRGFAVNKAKSRFSCPRELRSVFGAVQMGLDFNAAGVSADIVHCHTWYTHLGGILAKLNYGVPLVITVHSLEPLRPWKREQLGRGYDFSLWVERTALEMADAVVAVSEGTRADLHRCADIPDERIHTIFNGIDPNVYCPRHEPAVLSRLGIDPNRPYLLFVGRITRQKGIIHLVNAINYMDRDFQVVLAAGAPDTPEIGKEMSDAVASISQDRDGVFWIDSILGKDDLIPLYSQAAVFCCPSVYEPFGIINLEAMACETAVVAARIGGIPEVVVDGETGLLVELNQHTEPPFEPQNPDRYARDLAAAINDLMADPARRATLGKAGRERVLKEFSWRSVAAQTYALYEALIH